MNKNFFEKERRKLTILGILVAVIFATASIGHIFLPEIPVTQDNIMSNLELADYYSNQDLKVDGVYDLNKAEGYYLKAYGEDDGEGAYILYQLGRIAFLQGDFDKAIENFDDQLRLYDDTLPQVYYLLGLTYGYRAKQRGSSDDWGKAEKNFLLFIERSPGASFARVDLSWVYFSQGKYEEMLEPLKFALEYHPDNPWLQNMYGLALLNTEDTDEARDYFLKAKEGFTSMTAKDWGVVYPGNPPNMWQQGLDEVRKFVDKNIELTEERV